LPKQKREKHEYENLRRAIKRGGEMWEYQITTVTKTVIVEGFLRDKEQEEWISIEEGLVYPEKRAEIIAQLNVEGRDGWELVNVLPVGAGILCFWKKPKKKK